MQHVNIGCLILIVAALGFGVAVHADQQTGNWGDQGDGTYRNPVISADYSDCDVCRVGRDYYMVASTFESSPGLSILHSRDLVNWEAITNAFGDLTVAGPEFNWDRMARYGEGIFAPSIRYHAGKFYIFVNSHSGEGFYCCTAVNAAGPWTVTQIKDKNGKPVHVGGWTDPCPFWDDDGKAYLASSHPGRYWYSYLFQMTPDGTQLLDADADKMRVGDVIYAYPDGGTLFSPFQSCEGNKIYKRNGYYYLLHIEFLDSGHGQGTYIYRSHNIYGTLPDGTPGKPGDAGAYDLYKFGNADWNGQDIPGQGGLVDTPDGRWFWMGQFNRYGSDGRPPNLIPITWIDDWPVPGVNVVNNHGSMVWRMTKPIPGEKPFLPLGSDEFRSSVLDPKWQWNHQPRQDMWSLTEHPGTLRLHAFSELRPGNFFTAGNTIYQRFMRSNMTTVIVKLEIGGMTDGQEAGLVHMSGNKYFASIGVVQAMGARQLRYADSNNSPPPAPAITPGETQPPSPIGSSAAQAAVVTVPPGGSLIWLRSDVGFDNINAFSYSFDGKTFLPFGSGFVLRSADYRGDYIGIYTFNNTSDTGFVDADFHYTAQNR